MSQQDEWDADERRLNRAEAQRPLPRLFGRPRLRSELKALRVEVTLLRYELEAFMAVQPYKPFSGGAFAQPQPMTDAELSRRGL